MKTSSNSAYFGTNFCICSYILLFLVRTVKVYQDQKKISKIFWHHVTLYINTRRGFSFSELFISDIEMQRSERIK